MPLPGEGEVVAGSGEANAFAKFGLNPDGSAIVERKPEVKPEDAEKAALAAEVASLKTTIGKYDERLKAADGLGEKVKVLDKIAEAFGGKEDPNAGQYKKIFGEFMDVIRVSSPGMFKVLTEIQNDPTILERIRAGQDALAGTRIGDLNAGAHQAVLGAAKSVFKGMTAAELEEAVLPFEGTVTSVINANKELRARFVSGDVNVAVEVFNRLVKPHVSSRLRSKQERTLPSTLPKAVPRGGAGTPAAQGGGDEGKAKRDLRTPQGRMQFHKAAVGRYLDKRAAASDE